MKNDTPKKQPVWWTKDEFSRVRALAAHNLRDSLMILLATTYALRRSELLGLTLTNLSNGHISCIRAKGSLPVYEALTPEISELLARHVAEENITNPAKPIFDICGDHFNVIVRGYAKRANLPVAKRHAHCLRHTSIALHYRATRDIYRTKVFAGHVSIQNTLMYANLSPEEAAAANSTVLGSFLAA